MSTVKNASEGRAAVGRGKDNPPAAITPRSETGPKIAPPQTGKELVHVKASSANKKTKPKAFKVEVPTSESELAPAIRQALASMRKCWTAARHGAWQEVWAIGRLEAACDKAGYPYLTVVQQHLSKGTSQEVSIPRISARRWVYAYCRGRGLSKLPSDLDSLPPVSLIEPLGRFAAKPKLAEQHEDALQALHVRVFARNPDDRPTVLEVRKKVSEMLAPPGKPKPKPGVGLSPIRVGPKNLAQWFKDINKGKSLTVARIRPARPTADGYAEAVRAQWKNIRGAQLIQIDMGDSK